MHDLMLFVPIIVNIAMLAVASFEKNPLAIIGCASGTIGWTIAAIYAVKQDYS